MSEYPDELTDPARMRPMVSELIPVLQAFLAALGRDDEETVAVMLHSEVVTIPQDGERARWARLRLGLTQARAAEVADAIRSGRIRDITFRPFADGIGGQFAIDDEDRRITVVIARDADEWRATPSAKPVGDIVHHFSVPVTWPADG